jgi:biopolymer transport protein ExbD
MRLRRHFDLEETHGIDLAPMLDFVINLLIFFIITTSFIKESGTAVIRPEAYTAEARETGNILIAIKPTGEVWMDRRQVDLRQIRPTIERLHIERPDDTVVIVADKNSRAGLLGIVMDEVQQGGIKEVAIAAAPAAGG